MICAPHEHPQYVPSMRNGIGGLVITGRPQRFPPIIELGQDGQVLSATPQSILTHAAQCRTVMCDNQVHRMRPFFEINSLRTGPIGETSPLVGLPGTGSGQRLLSGRSRRNLNCIQPPTGKNPFVPRYELLELHVQNEGGRGIGIRPDSASNHLDQCPSRLQFIPRSVAGAPRARAGI
jgi:hypothetical protein